MQYKWIASGQALYLERKIIRDPLEILNLTKEEISVIENTIREIKEENRKNEDQDNQ